MLRKTEIIPTKNQTKKFIQKKNIKKKKCSKRLHSMRIVLRSHHPGPDVENISHYRFKV